MELADQEHVLLPSYFIRHEEMAPPQLVGFQCFYGSRHVEMNERRKECMIYMLYELKCKVRGHLVIHKETENVSAISHRDQLSCVTVPERQGK